GGQLSMNLTFRRARPDGAPGDEVRGELRRDRIQELAPCGQPQLREVDEESARPAQPFVDGEAPVEPWIVDEALPAHRGPRLLEVHAHHDAEVAGEIVGERLEPVPVIERGGGVVNRARAHHDHQPVVLAVQDPGHLVASAGHGGGSTLPQRQLLEEDGRGDQRAEVLDSEVAGAWHGVSFPAAIMPQRASKSSPAKCWRTLNSWGGPGRAGP